MREFEIRNLVDNAIKYATKFAQQYVHGYVDTAVKLAIKKERERIASILRNAEEKYSYSFYGDGGFDFSGTMYAIADRIEAGDEEPSTG